jgi:hypothetical protein
MREEILGTCVLFCEEKFERKLQAGDRKRILGQNN